MCSGHRCASLFACNACCTEYCKNKEIKVCTHCTENLVCLRAPACAAGHAPEYSGCPTFSINSGMLQIWHAPAPAAGPEIGRPEACPGTMHWAGRRPAPAQCPCTSSCSGNWQAGGLLRHKKNGTCQILLPTLQQQYPKQRAAPSQMLEQQWLIWMWRVDL